MWTCYDLERGKILTSENYMPTKLVITFIPDINSQIFAEAIASDLPSQLQTYLQTFLKTFLKTFFKTFFKTFLQTFLQTCLHNFRLVFRLVIGRTCGWVWKRHTFFKASVAVGHFHKNCTQVHVYSTCTLVHYIHIRVSPSNWSRMPAVWPTLP